MWLLDSWTCCIDFKKLGRLAATLTDLENPALYVIWEGQLSLFMMASEWQVTIEPLKQQHKIRCCSCKPYWGSFTPGSNRCLCLIQGLKSSFFQVVFSVLERKKKSDGTKSKVFSAVGGAWEICLHMITVGINLVLSQIIKIGAGTSGCRSFPWSLGAEVCPEQRHISKHNSNLTLIPILITNQKLTNPTSISVPTTKYGLTRTHTLIPPPLPPWGCRLTLTEQSSDSTC